MKYIDSIAVNDSILTATSAVEDDYSEWDVATAYVIGDRVISSTTHSVYQCLVGNTGNNPDTERADILNPATPTPAVQNWGYVGATRPWRMFDRSPTSVTVAPSPLTVTLNPGGYVNGIAFYGMIATSVSVTVNDPTSGVVYEQTRDLSFSSAITDIFGYFATPHEQLEVLVLTDLPALYPSSTIEISVVNTAGDVTIGEIDIGPLYSLGETLEEGTYFSRLDTSSVVTDDFGGVTDTKRPVLKISNFRSEIPKTETQTARRRLDTMRGADKRTFIGSDNANFDAIAFGYVDSADVTYEDAHYSIVKLRVIGVL